MLDAARLIPAVQAAIRAALQQAGDALQAAAANAYSGTRFAGTFVLEPSTVLDHVTLLNTNELLTVVEEPTRPHSIDAKHAPYLVFQVGGRWVRTKHVNHPGTVGKQAIGPLFADASAAFGRALEQNLQAVLRGL